MPTREVLAMFSEVAEHDVRVAQALSEPFIRAQGTFAIRSAEADLQLDPANLVALGLNFVDADPDYDPDEQVGLDVYDPDDVGLADAFYLNPNAKRHYEGFRAFVDGYKGLVHPAHKVGFRIAKVLRAERDAAEDPSERFEDEAKDPCARHVDDAIDQTMRSGLRTVAAVAVFSVGGGRHVASLLVPQAVINHSRVYSDELVELAKDGGDEIKAEALLKVTSMIDRYMSVVAPQSTRFQRQKTITNVLDGDPESLRAIGFSMGALAMPSIDRAEGELGAHPIIQPYVGKSRKQIRAMLREEHRNI